MAAGGAGFASSPVNVRIKISAAWTAMLFVFAYVDLFSLYRSDVRADLDAGEVGGIDVTQTFLAGTTAYVVLPSLMVLLTLVLQPRVNRIANIALAIVYAVTIIAGAIGEWSYYILGSGVEVALLAAVVYYALTWPGNRRRRSGARARNDAEHFRASPHPFSGVVRHSQCVYFDGSGKSHSSTLGFTPT